VIAIVFPIQQVDRLTTLRDDIANRQRIDADLQSLVESRAAKEVLGRCTGHLYVPNHRPIPQLAYWTGRRPAEILSVGLDTPMSGGTYIGPTTQAVAKLSILDPKDPVKRQVFPPGQGPPGFRPAVRNRSWILWAGC
jgi:hypothetical protein